MMVIRQGLILFSPNTHLVPVVAVEQLVWGTHYKVDLFAKIGLTHPLNCFSLPEPMMQVPGVLATIFLIPVLITSLSSNEDQR